MRKLEQAEDYSGRPMTRGDTVSTLNGQLTARVCDIADDGESIFVRLRPLHQPYGKGTWHAADRLIWIASASRRKRSRDKSGSGESTERNDTESRPEARPEARPEGRDAREHEADEVHNGDNGDKHRDNGSADDASSRRRPGAGDRGPSRGRTHSSS